MAKLLRRTMMKPASVILLLGLQIAIAPTAQADCRGCMELQVVKQKVAKFKATDDPAPTTAILEELAKAINRLPTEKGKLLSQLQAREVVDCLRVASKLDEYMLVPEETLQLLRANQKLIRDEIKRLPKTDGEDISHQLAIVMEEETSGNDSFPEKSVKPNKSGSPSAKKQ